MFWPWVQLLRAQIADVDRAALATALGDHAADLADLLPELRVHLPDLASVEDRDPTMARFRLFDAVARLLRVMTERRPLAVIIDDLQWADLPTILLLRDAARELHHSRVLFVVTYREGELSHDHPLARSLPDLIREPGCERLTLTGLGRDDLVTFVAAMLGHEPVAALVDTIYRITEGNPFFTREVVRFLESEGMLDATGTVGSRFDLPQSLRDLVRRRADRLSRSCNRLLDVGAVIGREFRLEHAGGIADVLGAELLGLAEEALAAQLVRQVPSASRRYAFVHAVVREAIYATLPLARRADLHRRIAEALEAETGGGPADNLAEIAHHYFEAAFGDGAVDKAVEFCQRAGDLALRLLAYEDAVAHYRRALDALRWRAGEDDVTNERRAELHRLIEEASARAVRAEADRARDDDATSEATRETATAAGRAIDAARKAAPAVAGTSTVPPPSDALTFRRDGEFWTLMYAGTTTLVRHGRGLSLLAYLIHHPGQRIHVREMEAVTPSASSVAVDTSVAAISGETESSGLGDAGPLLDARAKSEYRQHLDDLDIDLAEAERNHDLGRIEALRADREMIVAQLRGAVGLGGRDRRAASDVDRMRVAITRRIRAAIRQIATHHPAFAAHLTASVRTGYFCAYMPDASQRSAG